MTRICSAAKPRRAKSDRICYNQSVALKVHIATFGCQMNKLDSELVAGELLGDGFESRNINGGFGVKTGQKGGLFEEYRFMICFYPWGIWFIQPRVNKMFQNELDT